MITQDDERQLGPAGRRCATTPSRGTGATRSAGAATAGAATASACARCTTGASCRRRRATWWKRKKIAVDRLVKRDLYVDCTPRGDDALLDAVGAAAAVPAARDRRVRERRRRARAVRQRARAARLGHDPGADRRRGAAAARPRGDRAGVRSGVRDLRLPRGDADGVGVRGARRPAHLDGEPDRRADRARAGRERPRGAARRDRRGRGHRSAQPRVPDDPLRQRRSRGRARRRRAARAAAASCGSARSRAG